jgi:hypothetical protein
MQLWNYNFYNTNKYPTEPKWEEQRYYMQMNGKHYSIRKSEDSYYIGGRYTGEECGLLQVLIDEKTGVRYGNLNSVKKRHDCTLNREGGVSTRNIVLLAWKICFLLKLPYLTLDDGSNYYCEDGYTYPLGDVHLLTDGNTWYESIIDVKPITNPMYNFMGLGRAAWADTQRRARIMQWPDVESILPKEAVLKVAPYVSDHTGLAMPAFKQILKSPVGCWFFSFYTGRIFELFGMYSSKYFLWKTPPITTPQPTAQYLRNMENFYRRHSAKQ